MSRPIPGEEKLKRQNKMAAVIAGAILTVLVLGAVGAMLIGGNQEPVVEITDDSVNIKAQFGTNVPFSTITGITLREESMTQIGTGRRTFGYGGIGQTLKGQFESDELGQMFLYVQANTAPTIEIARNNGERTVFISLKDSGATRTLYEQLSAAFAAA